MTPIEHLKALFQNDIFLSAVLSLIIAQLLKVVFYLISQRKKTKLWEAVQTMLWRTGGMPSSHSALVCSLATSVAVNEGLSSHLFILSLVFAMVVLRDSMGVRRSSGVQAKAINTLGKAAAEKLGMEFHPVKEIQGHTPSEVLVGSLLGILIAVIFFFV
jgi:acid phosphatase family membrane protein YuiD